MGKTVQAIAGVSLIVIDQAVLHTGFLTSMGLSMPPTLLSVAQLRKRSR